MGEKYEERTIFIDGVEYHGLSECEIETAPEPPDMEITRRFGTDGELRMTLTFNSPTAKGLRKWLRKHPECRVIMKPRWRMKLRAKHMLVPKKWELF